MFRFLLRPVCWFRTVHRAVIHGMWLDGHSYKLDKVEGNREDLKCKTCGRISSAYYN